jgi:hypothetical protein
VWRPPPSIRAERPELPAAIYPGPDDPLGAYALRLGWTNYLIHGTNKPDGVGRNVSHGCIRLYPEDIARLFAEVSVGTPVRTVNQPAAAGWAGNVLYVAVYPSRTQVEEIDTEKPVTPDPAPGVQEPVRAAAGQYAEAVDWDAVDKAADRRTGVPVRVGERPVVATNAAGPDEGDAPLHERDDSSDAPRSLSTDRDRAYDGRPAPPDDSGMARFDRPDPAQPDDAGPESGTRQSADPARQSSEDERTLDRIERMIERAAGQQQ